MKILTGLVASTLFTIGALTTGCQSTNMPQNIEQTMAPVATYPISNEVLQNNYWQLMSATKFNGEKVEALFINQAKPLVLNFNKIEGQNLVSFMNTCNTLSTNYQIENGSIKLGHITSTLKACPEPEASFDSAVVNTVMGDYTLSANADKTPILVITGRDQVAHFKAVPKK